MSSHQLEYLNVSPHIALVLNLFQDHLDHAGTVEAYYRAKMNIFKYQFIIFRKRQ
jgi:UDP-N-acetylmuramoylalanine--D-glutamate ligase